MQSKSVLIVEDDEDIRTIYSAALMARGYQVLSAEHGAEGVHKARRHQPSLILTDIKTPVMDGEAALRYLKTLAETQHIPICAISAYVPEDEIRERVGQMGFDCYLMKPIDTRDLVAEVERLIGPPLRPPS